MVNMKRLQYVKLIPVINDRPASQLKKATIVTITLGRDLHALTTGSQHGRYQHKYAVTGYAE